MVERAGMRCEPETGNATVGGTHSHHAAKGCGLSDGAAGIRAQRDQRGALCDGSRGAATRATRNTLGIYRVTHGPECRILVRRAHRELVAVSLADDDAARMFDPYDGGGVVRRDVIAQKPGATS